MPVVPVHPPASMPPLVLLVLLLWCRVWLLPVLGVEDAAAVSAEAVNWMWPPRCFSCSTVSR